MVALLSTSGPARAAKVRVELEGLDGAGEDNVLSVLGIAQVKDDAADEAAVRRLHDRAPEQIAAALEPFGFYRVETRGELRQEKGGWIARYAVRPGPPIRLDEVTVEVVGEGAGGGEFREAVAAFALHEGEVLRHALYEQGKNRIAEAALDQGYLDGRFAEHGLVIDRVGYRATIRLRFDTGPRYYFGRVHFQQDILDSTFLRGYVTFHQGEPLDFDRLLLLQSSLSESPYFRSVEVRPAREDAVDQRVPIDVLLVPARRLRVQLGAGYGTDTGPQLQARPLSRITAGSRARCACPPSRRAPGPRASRSTGRWRWICDGWTCSRPSSPRWTASPAASRPICASPAPRPIRVWRVTPAPRAPARTSLTWASGCTTSWWMPRRKAAISRSRLRPPPVRGACG
jgi:outer membrane translocation and assembly module TamA